MHVSIEAYEDLPLDQIHQKASSKYDQGHISQASGAIIVTVRKTDFQ